MLICCKNFANFVFYAFLQLLYVYNISYHCNGFNFSIYYIPAKYVVMFINIIFRILEIRNGNHKQSIRCCKYTGRCFSFAGFNFTGLSTCCDIPNIFLQQIVENSTYVYYCIWPADLSFKLRYFLVSDQP